MFFLHFYSCIPNAKNLHSSVLDSRGFVALSIREFPLFLRFFLFLCFDSYKPGLRYEGKAPGILSTCYYRERHLSETQKNDGHDTARKHDKASST
jgi:hypothetical protein